ncbi:FadR/GntR family transcriptional regulator [Arenibaculum sp.]|uniref:FadR/GntR family transcriptional regulator n=1 Tax=Arenibaculum sp. TaxID=2865862 RepID=UPI002E139A6E|nr:FCD domain-containing protein [Arenibaculum sp.]
MLKSTIALQKLRRMIDGREFGTDGRLPPERQLAAELGVGRRTLRQALEVLEAEGRIWRRQGQGTFCGRPPPTRGWVGDVSGRTNPEELMEVRLHLESALAGLAALRATAEDIERLNTFAARTAAASDADAYELWDGAFHRKIAEIADNALFLAVFDAVDAVRQETSWGKLREAARTEERQALYAGQHRRLADAIAQRDGRAAEQAMREHLDAVREGLLRVTGVPART